MSGFTGGQCWVKVSNIPSGTNAEDVGVLLRVPPGESATILDVSWTSGRRTEALLRISGLGTEGARNLTAVHPAYVTLVPTPERSLSSIMVSSLILPQRDKTKDTLDHNIMRGQPLSMASLPGRAPQYGRTPFDSETNRTTIIPAIRPRCHTAYSQSIQMTLSSKDVVPTQTPEYSLPKTRPCIPLQQRSFSSPSELGIQSRTVRFEGVDETWDRDDFEMALDNEEQGGGEIEEGGIVMKGSMVYVTFKDATVAQRVVAQGNWNLLDRNVKVSLEVREPDPLEELLQTYNPANTVVLRGIPMKTSRQALLTHIAANTHLEEGKDYQLEEKNGTALVGLEADCNLDKFMKQISVPKYYLSDSTPVPLQAMRLRPVDSILLTKVDDKSCDKRKLQLYFSNRRRSGAGDCKDVEITGRGKAIATFHDTRNLRNILEHDHSMLGPDVTVGLYHPVLSEWNAPYTGYSGHTVREEHQPFDYPISDTLCKHLNNNSNVTSTMNEELCARDCCADLELPIRPPAIVVHPMIGSEWIRDWQQRCEQVLNNILGKLAEVVIDVPPDVAQKVLYSLLFNIQNTAVTVDQIEGRSQPILVGKKEEIQTLKSKVDKIVREHHHRVEEINLSLAHLVYIDVCLRGALSSLHPSVVFSVDAQAGTLRVSGTAPNVEEFLCSAQKAECVTKEVRLPFPALNLLASYDGKGILQKHILDYRIGYFFVSEDGSIPISDLVPVVAIHLVAETNQNLSSAGDRLSAAIAVDSMNTAEEFKTVVRLEAWDDMRRTLQRTYLVHIYPEPSQGKLHLASLAEHMVDVKSDLLQFLIGHCFMVEAMPVHKGQAEYLQKHSKEWMALQQEMKAHNVRCLVQPKGQNMEVRLNGETTPVKDAVARVRQFISTIAFREMHVTAPMAVKHLQSEAGVYQVAGIASSSQASIQVVTVPHHSEAKDGNAYSPFGNLEAPLQREICVGTVAEGGMTVSIMHGDLTDFHVDVIVNAANENLNHAGGIARELVRKGGDEIQLASTRYVRLVGKLYKGRAVLIKAVGKLPCRAIVHTVGPRWNGGVDNEQRWVKTATYASLKEARGYATVAFPALSTGVFRVPADVSAQGMLDGIVAFAKDNPRSSIEKVTIILYQEEHINPFVARAVTCLCDVIIKDQRFKNYTARTTEVAGNIQGPELLKPAVIRVTAIFKSVRVTKGNLTEQKADVYVSSAKPNLDVTKSELGTGGQELREDCYRHTTQHGEVPSWGTATTVAGNLMCKHVIHAVIGHHRQSVEDLKQGMPRMLKRILQECHRLKAKVVAVPALGIGDHGLPYEVAATIIIQAVVLHLGDNPATSIKEVILALNNDDIHTAFQAVHHQLQQEAAEMAQHIETPIKRLHSISLNDVSLEILSGDIEQIVCDGRVLVSTAEDGERDMNSLLRDNDPLLNPSLGPYRSLVEEHPLVPQEVRLIRRPQGEMVKCKAVLQVLSPRELKECQQTVLNILHRAEREKLTSVALPSRMFKLPGHSLDQSQVVSAIYGTVSAFVKDNMEQPSLKSISLVIPEGMNRTEQKNSSATNERTSADKLCIGVFGGSTDDIDRVIGEIRKLIDEKFHFEEVRDPVIDDLPEKSTDRLQHHASQAGVNIIVKRAPHNVIAIEGEKMAVSLMTTLVRDELERVKQAEHFTCKVQWQWRDVEGMFQNYPHADNWIIEEAWQRNDDVAWLTTEEGSQLVDFQKMMQHCLEQPFTVTEIRRQDVHGEGQIPRTWDPMPKDENCREVILPPDSHEYKEVADLFSRTMRPGVNVPGMTTPYEKIRRIRRIQNRKLHLQYTGRKQAMQCENPHHAADVEWKLWHGCKSTVVQQMNHGGFNRSYAATSGNVYGRGAYFARDASGAAHDRYSPRDEHRHKHIYLARVLVGDYTVGSRGLLVPPPKDPNNPVVLYDSVVDNQRDPHVFCIFQDSQAYPDYHIEFC